MYNFKETPDDYKNTMARLGIEEVEEWRKWCKEIPYIKFPNSWQVQIIPPITLAIVRFKVKKAHTRNEISVYLDCYNRLGFSIEPYWEIYPDANDSNARFAMADTEGLIKAIANSLKKNK